jgi:hypothetical protein
MTLRFDEEASSRSMIRLVRAAFRRIGVRALVAAGVLAIVAGCSDDSKVPTCEDCESWTQITTDLGRYPAPHPTSLDFLVYSTIRKNEGASDESREADEDLWLLWRGASDPAQWVRWQLTGDEIGTAGDNFQARWSPSGTQIAFVHTDPAGAFEVWRLGVTLPPGSPPDPQFDPRGTLERIAVGRDPAWLTEDQILFSREDKLYRIDVTNAREGSNELQISYDPPSYVRADEFVDRHPFAAADGPIVFSSSGRAQVGDLLVAAFEIMEGADPETTATQALLSLLAPDAIDPVYPLVDGADTLVTPDDDANPYLRLRSIPVSGGSSTYVIGARRDSRVFSPPGEFYCDSTVTRSVTLSPGEADTVRVYFELARGTLIVTSGEVSTAVTWERLDGRDTGNENVGLPCELSTVTCLLSHQVDGFGNVLPGTLEPYIVRGSRGDLQDSLLVYIPPGETTFVKLFCPNDSCGCLPPEPVPAARWKGRSSWTQRGAGRALDAPEIRAEGDPAIWTADLSIPDSPQLAEILSSEAPLQSPVLTEAFAGGTRYLAYSSNVSGAWGLFVQKLDANLAPVGDPFEVSTPGTVDNFVCNRSAFHAAFVPGSVPGHLRLMVTMTGCPDNVFGGGGIDDDPWSQGELNVWEVEVLFE